MNDDDRNDSEKNKHVITNSAHTRAFHVVNRSCTITLCQRVRQCCYMHVIRRKLWQCMMAYEVICYRRATWRMKHKQRGISL